MSGFWPLLLVGVAIVAALVLFVRRGRDSGGPKPVLVVQASQSGIAERIAEKTASALADGGRAALLMPLDALEPQRLRAGDLLLFIVSTTGDGDPPLSAASFARTHMKAPEKLPPCHYALLALGDRHRRHFCGFGIRVDAWLRESGAVPIAEMICVDRLDRAALESWRELIVTQGASASAPI